MVRMAVSVGTAAALIGFAVAGRGARTLTAGPLGSDAVEVADVVDGDTLRLKDGTLVRVLGIDAPETVHPHLAGAQPWGREAVAAVRAAIAGQPVRLQRDVTEQDHYGRQLRHVWIGGRLLAEELAERGLAHANIVPPDLRHAERIRGAEARAKANARGLWSDVQAVEDGVFATPPTW
jgi:micrococcal nuclease